MGLFNLFKKPPKIQDETFGEMVYCDFKDPSKNFFEGQGLFKPRQKTIGFTIDADESGPTRDQKDFYHSVENKYGQIKAAMIPLLNSELTDWYEGNKIEDFDSEFELESIVIPRMDKAPVQWSMVYVAKKIKHWATIEFVDFEPKHVLIDG
jgi:hypothetical protein